MSQENGKFRITCDDPAYPYKTLEQESIYIGRLETCEVVLDHETVSRIHAGINLLGSKYYLINLSSANVLTLNGRVLGPKKTDVLADGDTIQIGPFTVSVARSGDEILLSVERQHLGTTPIGASKVPATGGEPAGAASDVEGVLELFWEKRTRDKEDWGTRLRPTEKPKPGKAMYNWRPTRDLRRPWRFGLFIWAFLIVGAVGAFAYFRYPQTYAPMPLANQHAMVVDNSSIAAMSNGNSCTTCHAPNEPMENSCVRCHQGEQFHASNTKAHEEAGITCAVCHQEHKGADFDMTATAIQSCAQCHNDNNKKTYNGKGVQTAHGGSYGYPVVNGEWNWKGVYREVAAAIPEINSSATGDKSEQAKLSRHFHTIHVYRLKAPPALSADTRGLVSCSTCHNFEKKDLDKPKETCAACHTNSVGTQRDERFAAGGANCISCHVQHPYSGDRWSEFLTEDALQRRKNMVAEKIKQLNAK
ncbi:MAG: FHA domain-containing protein [Pyrinomonadaceae bacterium]